MVLVETLKRPLQCNKKGNAMYMHIWKKHEDEIVCACALAHKTDDATINALSALLGLSPSQVAFRMTNYIKQRDGTDANWNCSKQERRVFSALRLV